MGFRENVAKSTGIKKEMIPGSYQGIGHVVLLKFLPKKTKTGLRTLTDKQKKHIAEAILGLYSNFHVVAEITGIGGELRIPEIKVLKAEDGFTTTTIHKEHGLQYSLNVAKVMFSKGNLAERKRLIPDINRSEIIVDMFAGIGYFSLGLAKNAAKVYSIEKNRDAFYYLSENIELNKLEDKIEAIPGDCRIVADRLKGVADRISMGYFPNTEVYLPAALKMLKETGIIHYHDLADFHKSEKAGWDKLVKKVTEIVEENGYKVNKIKKNKVKTYAPHVWHVVLDINVSYL
ncbi:SAM-dependent methyltransferase [archaeon]|nr:SAM-dependent methyltransferase [archaeon]|tara:strand:+ start:47 stop:913 length:867 start_codon:yes stop_codon:yes gene_type:complete